MPQLALPILAVAAIVGTGLQAYSAISSSQAQAKLYQDQQQQEALRQQQMELQAKRARLEELRRGQRARALALANASNQGAQFGTGLLGGYGQIQGSEDRNLLALSQNLALGRANFGLNQEMTGYKTDIATAQGLGSLGGALVSSMGSMERLSGGFGGGSNAAYQTSLNYYPSNAWYNS